MDNKKEINEEILPIVKWVGGKRQLQDVIIPLIPKDIDTYVEPFLGGGAILFGLKPNKAIINDCNKELMNVYKVVKDNHENLLDKLKVHDKNNSKEYYYNIRKLDRTDDYNNLDDVTKASRLLYLNKTCFNGLYRVNSKGQFNSAYGKYKNPNIINKHDIEAVSRYLNNNAIKIYVGDYEEVLKDLDKNDFVYLDPPYMPISETSSFTGYTKDKFKDMEQERLKKQCDELNKKGIKFLLSNSDHPYIRDLYKDYVIETVGAKRSINRDITKRGKINELLIRNY